MPKSLPKMEIIMQPRLLAVAPVSPPEVWASTLAGGIPPTRPRHLSPIRVRLKHGLELAKRWLLSMLVLLGLCTLYDQGVGDGKLPAFNDLSSLQEIQTAAQQNSSQNLKAPANWETLSGGRNLLLALSPQLADWLYQLNDQQKIIYEVPQKWQSAYGKSSETPLLAVYEPWSGNLHLGAAFWALSDGEKAAILAHEYRHARQNWPKLISHRFAQWLTHGQLQYDTPLESEAFDYERQARAALGLSPLTAQLSP